MFFWAWAVGEGIIVYRWVKNGAPPTPGALLLPSGVYFGLAIVAEYAPARTVASLLAWAFDAAVLLQVVGAEPKQVTGWPPPQITDPSVILPGGAAGAVELTAYQAAPAAGAPSPKASTGGQTAPGFQVV